MNKEELRQALRERLEELDKQEFSIQMIDHWSRQDSDDISAIHREQREIRAQLAELDK